jgi:hypothetical protein
LLYVPWRVESTFLDTGLSWQQLFLQHDVSLLMEQQIDFPRIIEANDEYESEEDDVDDEVQNLEEFMIASRLGPNQGNIPFLELGLRDCDLQHDWCESSKKYEQYGSTIDLQNFIKNLKNSSVKENEEISVPSNCCKYSYSAEQLSVMKQIDEQIAFMKSEPSDNHSSIVHRTIVQGKAGNQVVLFFFKLVFCIYLLLTYFCYKFEIFVLQVQAKVY